MPCARGRGEAARITEFGGDRQRREIIDAAETAQPLDARPQRLEVEQAAQIVFDRAEPRDGFVDRAQIGPCVCSSAGSGHVCARSQASCRLDHAFLVAGEAAAVAEEKFREAMPRAEEIGADVLTTAQQIAGRFLLLGRDVDGRQRARAIQDRELAGIAAIRLDAIARRGAESRRARSRRTESRARSAPAGAQSRTGPPRNSTAPAPAAAVARTKRTIVGRLRRQRVQRRRPLARQQDGGHRRRGMLIEGDDSCRLHHDRPPLYAALLRAVAG